ncbi:HD domain-containing protein [Hathewaya limosa]|uniref:Nucleotidyltransferase with HDIG domain n=2 Tax=Hathewaya limosa TaxID=1536 RepID=A0ABU0JRX8_HATLI|nr:HD domain-containing protein [Hathewaya limosa]MDQ0479841.1 putative nucleotidyltransferase with HDIG domain [Hathewaya limosa]
MDKTMELYEKINTILLTEEKPSMILNKHIKDEIKVIGYPFNYIAQFIGLNQEPKYHPEGDVWNHTMQVVDLATQYKKESKDQRAFMWGAFLHDIGKTKTTKIRKGRITSYNHDIEGKSLAEEFLTYFREDKEFIRKVTAIVRWHMQTLFVAKNLPFSDLEHMKMEIDPKEIYLISLCDRLGRGPITKEKEQEVKSQLNMFLQKARE